MSSKTGRPGFTYRGISCHWQEDRQRFAGKVNLGRKADGKYHRPNVYGPDRRTIEREIRKLLEKKDKKIPVAVGNKPTVRAFFLDWIESFHAALEQPLQPTTRAGYRSDLKIWILPLIGHMQIDDVTVQHLDQIYLRMRKAGLSPGHIMRAHAVIRRGLHLAMARDLVHRNVAEIRGNPGSSKGKKVKPLATDATRRLIAALAGRPTGLRWMVGLALGPRQGEALGLTWECVDLAAGTVTLDWQLQRHVYEHGCADPVACAAPHCRTDRCVPSWEHGCGRAGECFRQPYRCPARIRGTRCPRHRLPCPAPCPAGCVRHAAHCKTPAAGGLVMTRAKTQLVGDEEGVDVVSLPPTLARMLTAHQLAQQRVKTALGDEYEDHGLVFCQPSGKPIDPRRDLADWHDVLATAQLPRGGTHVGRHTIAAVLDEAGEDVGSIQNVLRHADIRTTRGYGQRPGAQRTASAAKATEAALFSLDERRVRKAG